MEIIEIKPFNYHLYQRWLEEALKDDKIWPYMSLDKAKNYNIDVNDDWNQIHYIDKSGLCFSSLYFERRKEKAQFSIHTLSYAGSHSKKRSALRMMCELFRNDFIFKKHGIEFVDFSVHSTNENLIFFNKRFFPWGKQPLGGFDKKIGKWVDVYHYRIDKQTLKNTNLQNYIDKR